MSMSCHQEGASSKQLLAWVQITRPTELKPHFMSIEKYIPYDAIFSSNLVLFAGSQFDWVYLAISVKNFIVGMLLLRPLLPILSHD
mgnify:FL=1